MNRPPHIDPRWWAAASWPAKQRAVNARRSASRPVDPADLAAVEAAERAPAIAAQYGDTPGGGSTRLGTVTREVYGWPEPKVAKLRGAERVAVIDEMLNENGNSPEDVCARLGVKAGALENAMRRARRLDLARPFGRLRNEERKTPCLDCGKLTGQEHPRCIQCAHAHLKRCEVAA